MSNSMKRMFLSWLRTFLAAVLTAFITIVASTQSIPFESEAWIAILVAGILAVGPVIINYLNPNDTRYGRGASE